MRQTLRLTWAEFLRLLKAPASLYFFLGVVGFLGFIFWLTSTWRVGLFVDFAFLFLPLFFLAVASPQISRDRESGFAGILFTHPITQRQYYLAKFLSLHLTLGAYLLALAPFAALVIAFSGPGWLTEILLRTGWTVLITAFVGGLGLLISAGLGRRATLPSVSLGFAAAMILVFGPFLAFQYLGALGSEILPTALALLHVSPLMGAMDTFGSHGLVPSQPILAVLLSGSLAAALFFAGMESFRRLQSPEGWEAPVSVRVLVLGAVLALLVGAPLAVPFDYDIGPPQAGGSNCITYQDLMYCIWGFDTGEQTRMVGSTVRATLRLSVLNPETTPAAVPSIGLQWRSEYLGFNLSDAQFSSLLVQHDADVELRIPLEVSILRSRVMGTPEFGSNVPYLLQMELEGLTYLYQGFFGVVAPEYNRDAAWLVVLGLASVAVGERVVGRWRRGGG